MKTAKEYRAEAREKISGNWGMAILVIIIYSVLLGVAQSIPFGSLLITGALTVGLSVTFIRLIRNNSIELGDLFRGFSNNFLNTLVMGLLQTLFVILWTLLFVIPGIIAAYSYSMAPYILADFPETDGKSAIDMSKQLMKGKKGDLFFLNLSYIGWILLSFLTCGILLLWVMPWMQAANAAFYESIKHELPMWQDRNNETGEFGDTESI